MIKIRKTIFNKAKKLVDKVVLEGTGRNKEFYTFREIDDAPSVIINYQDGKTELESCSCTNCSVYGGLYGGILCSYRIAVIKAIPLK